MKNLSPGALHGQYTILGDGPTDAGGNRRKICQCACGSKPRLIRVTVICSGGSQECRTCALARAKRRGHGAIRSTYPRPSTGEAL